MKSTRTLKLLIWSYFWMLILEGALRKWFLPGLATPLLIVRDPIVIAALIMGFTSGKLKTNGYIATTWLISLAAVLMAVTIGHGNFIVAAYGWRANFLHLPFIFLIGRVFDLQDVKKMGLAFMLAGIGMAFIMALQFYSPQGSWINLGIGGEGDSGFSGALGYRRPSGTFSFTNGLGMFFPCVAAFVLTVLLGPRSSQKTVAVAAGLAVLSAIPLSISRGLLVGIFLIVAGAVIALAIGKKNVTRLLRTITLIGVIGIGASFIPGLEKPKEAFLSRWDASTTEKGGVEDAIVGRILNELLGGLSMDSPNLMAGAGLGMGTNAGARLLTGTSQVFLISEGEWGRLTGEMGMPLGLLFIGVRLALCFYLFRGAWKTAKKGEPLALILFFSAGANLIQGQWGQPTALGFSTLIPGLILAVINSTRVPPRRYNPPPVTDAAKWNISPEQLSLPTAAPKA